MNQGEGKGRDLRGDIAFAFGLAVACYVAWQLRAVLLLLYVSALAAVVLTPLVRATSHFRLGRWQPFRGRAILILMLAVAGCITAFGFLALPPVIRDLQEVRPRDADAIACFPRETQAHSFRRPVNTDEISDKDSGLPRQRSHISTAFDQELGGRESSALPWGLILTVYFILEGDVAYRWGLSFFPPDKRSRLDAALQRAEVRMGQWLLGQGSLMLLLGLTSTIVYVMLHVRYAYALGVLTGLLNIIPVLGAAVTVALVMLVAAIDSWQRVLGVAIFYFIWVQVENSFLVPRIMGTRVGLPGLSILVALLIGSGLGGVLGAIVSVPTAVSGVGADRRVSGLQRSARNYG